MPSSNRRDKMIDSRKLTPLDRVDILDLAVEGAGNPPQPKLKRGPSHKSPARNWKPKERK